MAVEALGCGFELRILYHSRGFLHSGVVLCPDSRVGI